MGIQFSEVPQLFGCFHLIMMVAVCVTAVGFFVKIRKRNESDLLKLLHRLGLIMIVMECFKQWFVFTYV